MKNQVMLGLIGLGVAGVAAFLYFKNNKQGTMVSPYAAPNEGYQSSQPAVQYPFQAPQAPRVDGSNQPWYGQNRDLQPAMSNTVALAADAKATATIVDSLSSIWGDLGVSDWFKDEQVDFAGDDSQEWSWAW